MKEMVQKFALVLFDQHGETSVIQTTKLSPITFVKVAGRPHLQTARNKYLVEIIDLADDCNELKTSEKKWAKTHRALAIENAQKRGVKGGFLNIWPEDEENVQNPPKKQKTQSVPVRKPLTVKNPRVQKTATKTSSTQIRRSKPPNSFPRVIQGSKGRTLSILHEGSGDYTKEKAIPRRHPVYLDHLSKDQSDMVTLQIENHSKNCISIGIQTDTVVIVATDEEAKEWYEWKKSRTLQPTTPEHHTSQPTQPEPQPSQPTTPEHHTSQQTNLEHQATQPEHHTSQFTQPDNQPSHSEQQPTQQPEHLPSQPSKPDQPMYPLSPEITVLNSPTPLAQPVAIGPSSEPLLVVIPPENCCLKSPSPPPSPVLPLSRYQYENLDDKLSTILKLLQNKTPRQSINFLDDFLEPSNTKSTDPNQSTIPEFFEYPDPLIQAPSISGQSYPASSNSAQSVPVTSASSQSVPASSSQATPFPIEKLVDLVVESIPEMTFPKQPTTVHQSYSASSVPAQSIPASSVPAKSTTASSSQSVSFITLPPKPSSRSLHELSLNTLPAEPVVSHTLQPCFQGNIFEINSHQDLPLIPASYNSEFRVPVTKVWATKSSANSVGNFAWRLAKDLYGPEGLKSRNYTGKKGKNCLSPRRRHAIEHAIVDCYGPNPDHIKEGVLAINAGIRNTERQTRK